MRKLNKAFLASCQDLVAKIEHVKNDIVAEFQDDFEANQQLFLHVINQADALAWQTGYPHLLFPQLALEKVQSAANWVARQQFVRREDRSFGCLNYYRLS